MPRLTVLMAEGLVYKWRMEMAKRRSPSSFRFVIELGLAISIIGLTLSVAVLPGSLLATFKSKLSEVALALWSEKLYMVEQFALMGNLNSEDESSATASAPLVIGRELSVEEAEKVLRQHGATGQSTVQSKYVGRLMRLGSNAVALITIREFPGTGVMSVRPAVPDTEVPATMTIHCGGGLPKGWVAAPERVANNLPPTHLPWFCRGVWSLQGQG